MKKSQLKNIIRESVKEVLNEQSNPDIAITYCSCNDWDGTNCLVTPSGTTLNNGIWSNTGNSPQVNDTFTFSNNPDDKIVIQLGPPMGGGMTLNQTQVQSCGVNSPQTTGFTCYDSNCLDCSNPQYSQYCNNPSLPNFSSLNACLTSDCGGIDGCRKCMSQHWSGYQNWYNNWTSSPPFNSTNPNQPCNHICNMKQQWVNSCTGLVSNPQWKNQLACKIETANNLTGPMFYGCPC